MGIENQHLYCSLIAECVHRLMEEHDLLKKNDWSLITMAAGDPPTPAEIGGSLSTRLFQKEILTVKMNVAKEKAKMISFLLQPATPQFS